MLKILSGLNMVYMQNENRDALMRKGRYGMIIYHLNMDHLNTILWGILLVQIRPLGGGKCNIPTTFLD